MPKILPRRMARIKSNFLKNLLEIGTISHAAQKTGIGRDAVTSWAKKDGKFSDAVNDAILKCRSKRVDMLKLTAYQRAVKQNGSDTLLIFLLKKWAPEEFGDFLDKASINENGNFSYTDFVLIAAGRHVQNKTARPEGSGMVDAKVPGFQSLAKADRNREECP